MRGVLVVVALAFLGCAKSLYPAGGSFEYQDEVGTAKLTVVSVAPWDEITRAITPEFTLSVADALQKAGVSVRAEDEAYLRLFTAALRLSLPTVPAPSTPAPGVGAKPLEPPKSGDLPSLSELKGALGTPGGTMSESSRYRLALALYQEVQLVNSYIRHVARPAGWEAYLVSMDLALLPARYAEVDAHVLVSFVPHDRAVLGPLPRVLPVVASDDVEINQHSRQVKNATQLALALAGAFYGVQAAAEFGRISEDLLRTVGRDLNSLQVVASVSENALVVRFGAGYSVERQYELVPQTRRVHALLLVPPEQKGKRLWAVGNTAFLSAAKGKAFPLRPYAEVLRLNTEEFNHQIAGGKNLFTPPDVEKLWSSYNTGDLVGFRTVLDMRQVPPERVHAAWAQMARMSLRSLWSYSEVIFPVKTESIDQPATLGERYSALDDKKTIRTTIPGKFLSLDPARWALRIAASDGTVIHLLPTSVGGTDRLVELKFPAVLTAKPPQSLTLTYRPVSAATVSPLALVHVSVDESPAKPAIRMLSEVVAVEADGTGEVILEVDPARVKSLTLEGTPAVMVGDGGRSVASLAVSANTKRLVVSLRHLAAGRNVVVVARGADDGELGRVSVPAADSGRKAAK